MRTLRIVDSKMDRIFELVAEAMDFPGLRYRASQLYDFGFEDGESVNAAINRAMRLCRNMGDDPRRHFRPFYAVNTEGNEIYRDWRFSKFGFYMVLCNGNPGNPIVGAFQRKLITNALPALK